MNLTDEAQRKKNILERLISNFPSREKEIKDRISSLVDINDPQILDNKLNLIDDLIKELIWKR